MIRIRFSNEVFGHAANGAPCEKCTNSKDDGGLSLDVNSCLCKY